MDELPLVRVAEVAFLTSRLSECLEFYRKIGISDLPSKLERLNFGKVGEQLFGFCDASKGFIDGSGGYVKAQMHVAFEVPFESLDDCITFLNSKGIKTSPKIESEPGWHGASRSTSVYFSDPAGNILELWAPNWLPSNLNRSGRH